MGYSAIFELMETLPFNTVTKSWQKCVSNQVWTRCGTREHRSRANDKGKLRKKITLGANGI